AEALRDHILKVVGVPVTVGVARTRTLAKLVSDTAKPFGARALLDAGAERELLARTPVTEVSGIAARRAARLAPFGITTCRPLPRAGGGGPGVRPPAVDGDGRGPVVGADRRPRYPPPDRAPAPQDALPGRQPGRAGQRPGPAARLAGAQPGAPGGGAGVARGV